MGGFKLVAIIPLEGCDKKFRKNLKEGFPYQFYQAYDIELNSYRTEVTSVNRNKEIDVPDKFYSLDNGIELSLSAVIGKNGSGKSTLFEMLYYLVYVLGTEIEYGKDKKKVIDHYSEDLEKSRNSIVTDYNSIKDLIEEEPNKNEIEALAFKLIKKHKLNDFDNKIKSLIDIPKSVQNQLFNKLPSLIARIKNEKENESHIGENLAISIIYEFDNKIYEIYYFKGLFKHNSYNYKKKELSNDIKEFDLSDFFYSVSINYSHHSLNSEILGNWISKLFHKNDGYTTPLVINPMRSKGNFDINHELRLSKERLMSNLVFDLIQNKKTLLLNKYKVSKFVFSPKVLTAIPIEFTEDFINDLKSDHIFKNILQITKLDDHIDYWDFAISYLERKISRIDDNYDFIIYENDSPTTKKQLDHFLINHKSHITKKIRQVINFLKITNKKENRGFWKYPGETARIELSKQRLLDWLDLFKLDLKELSPNELIEYALPGFFNIDFKLKDVQGHEIEFGELSSGEQQLILNSNSILYHLYNLQSVFEKSNAIEELPKRVKYENVNIILDEVELYYHPEMQRLLVQNLIDSLEKIKKFGDKGIKSINVCILSHSPFILSDIPVQNVLKLRNDEVLISVRDNDQTFGSNIHELLTNSFFMDSTTGAFAENKIREIVEFHYKVKSANEKDIGLLREEYFSKKQYFNFIAENIGEDLIKGVLENHIEFIEDNLYTNN